MPTKSGKTLFPEYPDSNKPSNSKSFPRDLRDYAERGVPSTPANTTGSTPESNAVLVLRYKHGGKMFTRVWKGHSYYHVIVAAHAAAKRAYAGKPTRMKSWGKRQDEMVMADYASLGPSVIARNLTAKYKRQYTKNMVISRYHRLKYKEKLRGG